MHLQNLLSTFHEPSAHLHLSHKHISASFKVQTILYLHFPRTVNHLCPARSTALYSIMLQSSCAKKKKKVLQEKSLNFSPLCWSWSLITIFPISRYELSATHAKKLIKIYTTPFHYILCTGTKVYIINQGKKERKKKCTDH